MYKRSPNAIQHDIFSSASLLMSGNAQKILNDPKGWHNQFYKNFTSRVPENLFKALYSNDQSEGKDGRGCAAIRILVGMCVLKEGTGCSDEQLYENCQMNFLWRYALGLVNLQDTLPTLRTYYNFRRKICEYEELTHVNLFEKCFSQVTRSQVLEYNVSGKSIRMDSKIISSNIAWYSRYEIVVETFKKSVSAEEVGRLASQTERDLAKDILGEDSAKTVYTSDSESMNKRMLQLGCIISHILDACAAADKKLLHIVFTEQYEKDADGNVSVRDKKLVSASSVQNPNDPDAEYRSKNGKKSKGYVVNITETCDQTTETGTDERGNLVERPAAPNLIVSTDVKGASTPDNSFVKDGVEDSRKVTGIKVEKLHADGAYQSENNRRLAADEKNGFQFLANGIQGKPSRFILHLADDGELNVTDKTSGEVIITTKVKDGVWKIPLIKEGGTVQWRYFREEDIERSKVRQEVEAIPFEERMKRNNVEASIFQYCFHTRNNKTRYRGLIKHTIQAIARCAWINTRRLFLFDLQPALS